MYPLSLSTFAIKQYTNIKGRSFFNKLQDAATTQEQLFQKIKANLRGTKIYNDLRMENVSSYTDYVRNVPLCGYTDYLPYVEAAIAKEPKILFNDPIKLLVATSGTTGFNNKLIPYNQAMIDVVRNFHCKVLYFVLQNSLNFPLSAKVLLYGAKSNLEPVNSLRKEYISGILGEEPSFSTKRLIVPSPSVIAIENFSQKVEAIYQECRNQDIWIIGGVPSYLINVLRTLLEISGKQNLLELWPNLQLCLYSGTSISIYEHSLNVIAGKKLLYAGTYIASEAPLGIEVPSQNGCQFIPNLDEILYSFCDVDHPSIPLSVSQLEVGGEYLLNTGSPNGFLQYEMKDYVKITSLSPFLTFSIQGRHGTALNIATEKVSHEELNQTIYSLQRELSIAIEHYFVYPVSPANDKPHYEWVLALDRNDDLIIEEISERLDLLLCEHSLDYDYARKAGHINPCKIKTILPQLVEEYFKQNRHRGQFKMKSIFKDSNEFYALFAEQNREPFRINEP